MRVLGIDIGFARFGWALADLSPDEETLVAAGCIITEKATKKRGVLATEDNFDRGRILASELNGILTGQSVLPRVVTCESMSWPRNAANVAKMGIAWGILIGECERWNLSVAQATPQEIKKRVAGEKSATKEDIQSAIDKHPGFRRIGSMLERAGVKNADLEHPYDAAASILACLRNPVIMALRGTRT